MTEFLLDHGAKVDMAGSRGRTTALAEVAKKERDISLTKLLIERGANPLIGFGSGQSAFEWAVRRMNPEMVELFLRTIAARRYQCVGLTQLVVRTSIFPQRRDKRYKVEVVASLLGGESAKAVLLEDQLPCSGLIGVSFQTADCGNYM